MKLLKEYPAGTPLFTSSPPEDGSLRREVTPAGWSVHCWLIDKDTPLPTDSDVSVGVEGLSTAPNPAVKRQKVGCSELVETDTSPKYEDVGLGGSSDPPLNSGNCSHSEINSELEGSVQEWFKAGDTEIPETEVASLGDPNYPAPLWHVPLELNGAKVNALFGRWNEFYQC
jgi:hypothetical protein